MLITDSENKQRDPDPILVLNDQSGGVICYAPESCNCTSYRESETAATMITGYHYGGGGDAALILTMNDKVKGVDLYNGNLTGDVSATLTVEMHKGATNSGQTVMIINEDQNGERTEEPGADIQGKSR